ncbi:MAG TPA: hypothetical protein P5556_10790 [Candidatus Gastranaerophilales bacterium]|nr:hypothetical protein [Candidatus Gastranaerophilales bacterium]
MPKFKINYYFDGNGSVEVEAKNEDEAREMFFNGDFSDEEEWGENYNIENIQKWDINTNIPL